MKKINFHSILILSICLSGMIAGHAQPDRPVEERIEAQRIAFITQRVNLSPEEAQAFWPIYNEYRTKEKKLRENRMVREDILEMEEKEAAEYLGRMLDLEQEELNLKKDYTQKLKSVLSARKILRFYAAERMFKERLLQAMHQRRNNSRE
jgi:hypothetical protein